MGVQEGLVGVPDGPDSGPDGLDEACVGQVLSAEHVQGIVDGLDTEYRVANYVGVHLTLRLHEGLAEGCDHPTVLAAEVWEDWRSAGSWIVQHLTSSVNWLVHYHYCYYY